MPETEQEEIKKLKNLRTAIALIAGGFAAIKLSQHFYVEVMGIILMPLGLLLSLYSFIRYFNKQKLINLQKRSITPVSQHHEELHEKQASRSGTLY